MTMYAVTDVGRVGVISDALTQNVPLEAWTGAYNVRFRDDGVLVRLGRQLLDEPIVDEDDTASRPPEASTLFTMGEGVFTKLILCCDTSVWARDVVQYANITRAAGPYTSIIGRWTGGILGGLLVLNNGVDIPQYWHTAELNIKLLDAPFWPDGIRCGVLRPHMNYLFMGDVWESDLRYPERLRWSAAAAAGLMPDDYDVLSLTNDANELELPTNGAAIVDMVPLGQQLMVYKTDSIWSAFLSGSLVSAFFVRPVLTTVGAFSKDCVTLIKEGKGHLVFTGDDLVQTDGSDAKSVLDLRTRRRLQHDVVLGDNAVCFLTAFPHQKEAWLFYTTAVGSAGCDSILIWNWQNESITHFQADGTFHAVPSLLLPGGTFTWDSVSGIPWDELHRTWEPFQYQMGQLPLVSTSVGAQQKVLELGSGLDGGPVVSYVERTGIGLSALTKKEKYWRQRMLVNGVWPHATGGAFEVTVGTQDFVNGPVSWGLPQTFVPGATERINTFVSGRYVALRFHSANKNLWMLKGYELDVVPAGEN